MLYRREGLERFLASGPHWFENTRSKLVRVFFPDWPVRSPANPDVPSHPSQGKRERCLCPCVLWRRFGEWDLPSAHTRSSRSDAEGISRWRHQLLQQRDVWNLLATLSFPEMQQHCARAQWAAER